MISERTIQSRFFPILAAYPDHPAIEYRGFTMTYRELDQYSNCIAHRLLDLGVKKETFIAIALQDKMAIITAVMGILKAGCVFVPLDITYPEKRLEAMLATSETPYIITCPSFLEACSRIRQPLTHRLQILLWDEAFYQPGHRLHLQDSDAAGGEDESAQWHNPSTYSNPPVVDYLPQDRAYIYFTSGTTGLPKAVVGKNEGLTHFIAWEIKTFQLDHTIRTGQLSAHCHDPFSRDILIPFCTGGTVCVPPGRDTLLETAKMVQWMEQARVGLVHSSTALFRVFGSRDLGPHRFPHLRFILLAGEKVAPQDIQYWYSVMGARVQLVNLYGPTETTMSKLYYLITPADVNREVIPLGSPLPGSKVIILNPDLQVCGPGEVGEIYIRTPFRSHGYYNDPVLNGQRFIQNPFSDTAGDIIYKSGDLGRVNAEGLIEFMGRQDRQVKIRGFRVELDEIERRVRDFPGITDAVVLFPATAVGTNVLCVYYIGAIAEVQLKEHLRREMPDYMVPPFYFRLERFPLNVNGKVDFKAFPLPGQSDTPVAAPRDYREEKIIEIWRHLLGIQNIGIDDGFLDCGGNSLNAMLLTARLYQEFNVNLELSAIFANPTPAMLAMQIRDALTSQFQRIEVAEEREYYPLSSSQMRMFLLKSFAGQEDTGYNQPRALLCTGTLDIRRLETAFAALIQRHQTLRTGFETLQGVPVQRIWPSLDFAIEYHQLDRQMEKNAAILAVIHGFIRPFDLACPPLLRVGWVTLEANSYLLLLDTHHIISDGYSARILIEEFMALYQHQLLPEPVIQYKDYALWQQRLLHAPFYQAQQQYWLTQFKTLPAPLNLYPDYPRPLVRDFTGSHFTFPVDMSLFQALEQLARAHFATLYMVLLAAYNVLLFRYTQQEDLVIGSPIAGRSHSDVHAIPGVFVNTLAMRNQPAPHQSFDWLLGEVKKSAFQAYENQDYPFEELVRQLGLGRDVQRAPLCETMFSLQNIDFKPLHLEGADIAPYPFDIPASKFDISLAVLETPAGYSCAIEYSTRLFRRDTIQRFSQHWLTLLQAIVAAPQTAIAHLEILTAQEKECLLFALNPAPSPYPSHHTLHSLFIEQAARTPDALAMVGPSLVNPSPLCHLTYQQLLEKAEMVSAALLEKGITPESIVAIKVERSIELMMGILGILMAGAAYLPLDPDYPPERIDYMLRDSATTMMITENPIHDGMGGDRAPLWGLDQTPLGGGDLALLGAACQTRATTGGCPYGCPATSTISLGLGVINPINHIHPINPTPITPTPITPTNLSYIIYTSGSTGNPKGVMIQHNAVVNLIGQQREFFKMTPWDRILQFSTLCFDASVEQFFTPLSLGATVVLIPKEIILDSTQFPQYVTRMAITHLHAVPSFLNYLDPRAFPYLKRVVAGGEVCSKELAHRWFQQVAFYNEYGPTETTVTSIEVALQNINDTPVTLPIGTPMGNTTVFLLDPWQNMVPMGVPGEIYIGGTGLARGYLNNPTLTQDTFLTRLPFLSHTLYRTGDLARWLPDGQLEFLGRTDTQVKIRGFRIECGEIEACLLAHEAVTEVAVAVHPDATGTPYLCAYIASSHPPTTTAWRQYLLQRLPDYMVPARFVCQPSLPHTPAGKIDRAALLPVTTTTDPAAALQEYTPPSHPVDVKLVAIWTAVLGDDYTAPIGIHTDFFQAGGHSLKAAMMLARLHETFNVSLAMRDLFLMPTIAALSQRIRSAKKEFHQSITPAPHATCYPLSFQQKRLWILHTLQKKMISYHLPLHLHLDHPLDEPALRQTLTQLLLRHESFRTALAEKERIPYQWIHPPQQVPLPFHTLDISAFPVAEQAPRIQSILQELAATPFALDTPPLWRAIALQQDSQHSHLLVNIHHIIADGWSLEILRREFALLYHGFRIGQPISLPPLVLQYKDFCYWENTRMADPHFKAEAHAFWQERLSHGFPTLVLPVDALGQPGDTAGALFTCIVPHSRMIPLQNLALARHTTLNILLFSIFNILLAQISNQEEVVCAMISAGRDHLALEPIVGYFTTSIPIKTYVDPEEEFHQLLQRVHETVLDSIHHQAYPLELVLDELKMPFPDISVSFNMLNLPGLKAQPQEEAQQAPLSPHQDKLQGVKFDLSLLISLSADHLQLQWHYRQALFAPETIEAIAQLYHQLLEHLSS